MDRNDGDPGEDLVLIHLHSCWETILKVHYNVNCVFNIQVGGGGFIMEIYPD